MSETITVANGKYTIINDNGQLSALRHGEPWNRDLVGDNLVYWMFVRIRELEEQMMSVPDQVPGPWRWVHRNDGPNSLFETWSVTDGRKSIICRSREDADLVTESLNVRWFLKERSKNRMQKTIDSFTISPE